jgi:hypothetical protein
MPTLLVNELENEGYPDGLVVRMHDMLFWAYANIQGSLGQKMKIRNHGMSKN